MKSPQIIGCLTPVLNDVPGGLASAKSGAIFGI
jgi:hypothetical protein